MSQYLSVPLEHVKEPCKVGTLVTVDCQHGESNVAAFDAEHVFVIDHHEGRARGLKGVVSSHLGSCSTLVWDLLRKENFDFDQYPDVSTALYYGLLSDTNGFEEITHPLDKDARDSLQFDKNLVNTFRFNNLTITELGIAGTALTRYRLDNRNGFAVFKADACDQNILGFIGDLALQVEGVDVCIVYNTLPGGYKLSIRSCAREVMANELADYLAGGGGHRQKAGAFISESKLEKTRQNIDDYIEATMRSYFDNYDIIDSANHNLNVADMKKYKKRGVPVGYVKSTDVFAAGTPMLIRTLEGDAETEASDDIYLIIGILGEVYPAKAERFHKTYARTNEAYEADFTYSPTAKNKITGESASLIPLAKTCIATGESRVFAMPAERSTKIFTAWNTESYMYGKPGDYIAVREDDMNDVYIIREDIFGKTYENAE